MTLPVLAGIRPPSIGAALNGELDAGILVNVGGARIRMLAREAAEQFVRLRQLVRVDVGVELGILPGGAYRSYVDQVMLFNQRYETPPVAGRPTKTWSGKVYSLRVGSNGKLLATAAVPGTSNHGIGAAVDCCELDLETGGYLGITSSQAWPWLLEHVVEHGWSWELQSEPWHLRLVALPPAPPTPIPPEEQQMAYFRDDRVTGWQIWVVSTDAVGNVWTCPISDLPDRGKWGLVQPLVGDPPVKPFGALVGLMDAQNRPTPPTAPPSVLSDHVHIVPPVSTSGVAP